MSHVASGAVGKTLAVLLSCGTSDYPCCCHVGHVTSYLDAAKIRKVSESWCNGRDFLIIRNRTSKYVVLGVIY